MQKAQGESFELQWDICTRYGMISNSSICITKVCEIWGAKHGTIVGKTQGVHVQIE